MTPIRIQRSRKKGWRAPPTAMYVGRPTKFGNPFVVHSDRMQNGERFPMDAALAVSSFRSLLLKEGAWFPIPLPWPKGKIPNCEPTTIEDVKRELRGHDLICWCPLDRPCHADVLLKIANA